MDDQEKKLDLSSPEQVAEAVKQNDGKPVTTSAYIIFGIFGELPGCEGLAEDVINTDEKLKKYGLDPAEGGTFIKLMGCSFLYKGDPATEKVKGIEQAKSNISTLPREIIGRSIVLSGALGFLYIFFRKQFWRHLCVFAEEIRLKTIRIHDIPAERYCRSVREIKRAMEVAVRRKLKIPVGVELLNEGDTGKMRANPLPYAITKLMAFFALFLELDVAYRFPMQDVLGERSREGAQKSITGEVLRILQTLINRDTPNPCTLTKFKYVKKVIAAVMLFSPQVRGILREFLMELDADKVKLDEADWYFCLRRSSYNYRGMPLADRFRELYLIDRAKGHQYINIEFSNAAEQPKNETGSPEAALVEVGTPEAVKVPESEIARVKNPFTGQGASSGA